MGGDQITGFFVNLYPNTCTHSGQMHIQMNLIVQKWLVIYSVVKRMSRSSAVGVRVASNNVQSNNQISYSLPLLKHNANGQNCFCVGSDMNIYTCQI